MKMGTIVIAGVLIVTLAAMDAAVAGGRGNESMQGMAGEQQMEGHGSMDEMKGESPKQDHGMMAMGDKVFEGKVGPWSAEIHLADTMAQMAKANVSERMKAKMKARMKNTHHLSVSLTDSGTKMHVTEGKGSVTVTGPDKKQGRYDFVAMVGHFGADMTLGKPGKYDFEVSIESGGKRGTAAFSCTNK